MQSINLKIHLAGRKQISEDLFARYAKIECADANKITKSWEEDDLDCFCHLFDNEDYQFFDHFFYNFRLSLISKEFDLLRFGSDYIINIELKHTSTKARVVHQLRQNQMYLKALRIPVLSFAYIAQSNTLYALKDDHLEIYLPKALASLIHHQKVLPINDIEELFTPELYLVSPLTSPTRFLNDAYFLTDQQQMIKNEIVKAIEEEQGRMFVISGGYSTGKTLLVYDIIKQLKEKYRIGIVQSNRQYPGIESLRRNGYENIGVQDISDDTYNLIVIDSISQLDNEKREKLRGIRQRCIMTYNPQGWLYNLKDDLALWESLQARRFSLTHVIHLSENIAAFASSLMNRKMHHSFKNDAVHLAQAGNVSESQALISYQISQGYTYVPLSSGSSEMTDLERVVICLDESFYYEEGKLCTKNRLAMSILLKTMACVKDELFIIVVNNGSVFTACVEILGEYYE